jgi:hypothetical protein
VRKQRSFCSVYGHVRKKHRDDALPRGWLAARLSLPADKRDSLLAEAGVGVGLRVYTELDLGACDGQVRVHRQRHSRNSTLPLLSEHVPPGVRRVACSSHLDGSKSTLPAPLSLSGAKPVQSSTQRKTDTSQRCHVVYKKHFTPTRDMSSLTRHARLPNAPHHTHRWKRVPGPAHTAGAALLANADPCLTLLAP